MIDSDVKNLQEEKHRFLTGGGEMGALTRAKEWSKTSLGNPASWPQSLKTTIGIILNSKFPMFLFWGPELICFYNDAYRPSLGQNGKHPGILGIPAQKAWPEIWAIIKPLIDQVLDGGEATWSEDQLIPIFRNGKIEDVYWTFSYSPVHDDSGNISGVLVTCSETTDKVLTHKKIEESKNQLQFAIDAADLATWDIDPATGRFTGNDRLKEWHGLPPQAEFDLETGFNVVLEKDREMVQKAIAKSLEFSSGGILDIEYTIVNPLTQKERIVRSKGRASFGEGNIASRLNGTLQDVTAQVTARKKIEESEKEFRQLAESLPALVWTTDNKGTQTFASRRWKEFTGLNPYDASTFEIMTHPSDLQSLLNIWADCLATGKIYKTEVRIKNKNGEYHWFYVNGEPVKNEQGVIEKWIGTFTNINDQKKAQEELVAAFLQIEESEKRFRDTVQQAPLGITILRGSNFFVEMANDAYLRLVDRPKTDFIGKPLFESLPEVEEIVHPLLTGVLTTGTPFYATEFPVNLSRYGVKEDLSYFNLIYHPLKEENGNISGVMVVATEVTDMVKTRHSLAIKEKQFRDLVMQSPIAMSIFRGEENIIEMANKVMVEKIWRREEIDVIGKKLLDAFPELKEQKYPELLQEVYRSGKLHNEKESLAYVGGKGGMKKFWFDYEYHPLKEPDGTVSGLMITVNDVTEQVEARKRIEENEDRLRMATQLTKLGTWEYNPISGELNWSDECKDIYGLPDGTAIDFQVFAEHIYPADREYVEAAIQHSMDGSGDGKYDISYRIIRFDDTAVRWIRATGKVYFSSANQAERFIGTVLDITAQRLSQEILEESEQRSRLAIEAASMGTFDWNLISNEFISSQRLNDIFGFIDQPQITHQNLLDAFHPEDKPRRDEAVKKAGAEGSLSYEARIKWPDASIHWVRVFGKVIYDGPQPSRMYGTVIDITDEKRNTIALEENTARLNIAIEAAELGAWELNLKTREPYYSERYLEMLGFQKDDTPNHEALISKIHIDDLPLRNEAIQKAMQAGFLDIEMRIRPNADTIRWVRARGKTFYDENGVAEKMLGTLMDITEAKNTLNVLLESEERFRSVANSAPVFIWMAGIDKLRYFFNLAWLKFTGRTMEQEKGYGWTEGVHPEDFNKCVNYYIDAFDKKEEFYMEYRLKRYDGEYRWMSARAVPRFSTTGIFEGYIGACMDIHEQVIYQKKLKEDEERLNIIINASELGTWELNLKTKGAKYSDRCLQILGYSNQGKASREKILKQFHPDDLLIRAKAFKRALITGVLFFEARVSWADHSIHWIESKGKVFYDDNNDPSHIIGTLRDITEQKYYQQELEDREKKFRLLADSMPELVWTGDVEGNLNYFNQSVYDYTGLTPEQIRKEGWLQIVHPDEREENVRLWLDAVSTGKDFLFEHRFQRHDGEYNWQLSRAVPQKDAAGNILMWVGTSTNIQQIKEQDQLKDLFISMASHELKTPVTSIKGYVQILQSMYAGGDDKFLKSSLDIVDRQIVTLTKLISELLDLSKIKSGNLVLNQENFDLNELIKDKIDEIKHINAAKSISFSKKGNPIVYADRDRIGQVLINFLTNAVKYSPDTLKIKVNAVVNDDNVLVYVEDSGIGINKADQEKIFQRFYRVEGKNEKTFPGFGIGLFIAAEIINRHNGKIGVESEPGKGSTFYFSLPISNPL